MDRTVCWKEKQFQVLYPVLSLGPSHAVPEEARRPGVSSLSIWVSCRERKINTEEVMPGTLGHLWPKAGNIFSSLLPCLAAGKSQPAIKSKLENTARNKSVQAESTNSFQLPSLSAMSHFALYSIKNNLSLMLV